MYVPFDKMTKIKWKQKGLKIIQVIFLKRKKIGGFKLPPFKSLVTQDKLLMTGNPKWLVLD